LYHIPFHLWSVVMIKKGIMCALSILLLIQPPIKSSHKKTMLGIGITGISIASLYGVYRWLSTPEQFTPTIENLNTLTIRPINNHNGLPTYTIETIVKKINKNTLPEKTYLAIDHTRAAVVRKGIVLDQHDQTVFIFSRGYAQTNKPGTNDDYIQHGGCAKHVHTQFHDNIINNCPCITFDYPDQRRCFNFGQETDLACLNLVYQKTIESYPDVKIILVGDCRGGKAALSYATQKPKNLQAIVLMSPFVSAHELTEQLARNYLSWVPRSSGLLQTFFSCYFPNYDTSKENLFEVLDTIDPTLPIFIGHRKNDKLVADATINRLVDTLKNTGNPHVHLFVVQDDCATHSRLTPIGDFQQGVNMFLQSYALPYNQELVS